MASQSEIQEDESGKAMSESAVLKANLKLMSQKVSLIEVKGVMNGWAIVYLAQMKPLIVPILNEAESRG
ncbi:hypothetical protein V2J09_017224 [Rumex salicifolius]